MIFLDVLLILVALSGHASLCVALTNNIYATAMPFWFMRLLSTATNLAVPLVPAAIALSFSGSAQAADARWLLTTGPWALRFYFALALAIGGVALPLRYLWLRSKRDRHHVRRESRQIIDVARQLGRRPVGNGLRSLVTYLPRNEQFLLDINEKELFVPGLCSRLDGLVIAHWSDLHFGGAVDRAYFDAVAAHLAAMEADLVVLSGDLIDSPQRIHWIGEVLRRISAPFGCYAVLGNHDWFTKRVDEIRTELTNAGWVDLGGRWIRTDIRGVPVVLAGNELPWLPPAADLTDCPSEFDGTRAFRLLVAHSPDQFAWAKRFDFDLMLAGHTHGGQIRLPIVGPIVAPSRSGVAYASGVFYGAPTVMHVSRGISGAAPVRYNCRPEVTRLVLRSYLAGDQPSDSAEQAAGATIGVQ